MGIDFRKRWRVGRHLGRTLYVAVGDEASRVDIVFGMVDYPEVADHIVRLHNEWCERAEEAKALRERGFTAGAHLGGLEAGEPDGRQRDRAGREGGQRAARPLTDLDPATPSDGVTDGPS